MFGFFAANAVTTEAPKTAVDKMKRIRMAGRLPFNPRRENGKNGWIKIQAGRPSIFSFKLASSFSRALQPALFPSQPNTKNISFIMKPFGVTTEVWVTLVLSPRSSNVYAASMSNCLPIITTVCAVGR